MLQYLQFPLEDEAIGTPVNIVGGILDGRAGVIDSLPTNPRSNLVMVELDRDGGNVWIEVEHLEETPNTQLYSGRPEVLEALTRFANGVMRKARAEVEHIVAGTKRGTVFVSYTPATRVYEITTNGGRWTARGAAAAARRELMNLRAVAEAGIESRA